MIEKAQEEQLLSEANVVSETPVEVPVKETIEPVKKKKNPVVVILLVLVGLVALCCACSVGGYFVMKYAIQKTPQAVAVNDLYMALNEGDSTKVKSLSTEILYNDLYAVYDDGTTLAGVMKGNIEKVTIVNVNIENDTATVTYTLTVTKQKDAFAKVTYAELIKQNDKWVVSYIGTPESSTTSTPTPTSYFEY